MFAESKFIKNKIDLFHIILPLASCTNFVLYIIIPIFFAKFFKFWKKSLIFTNYLHFFYKKSKTRSGTPLFWCPLRDKFSCFGHARSVALFFYVTINRNICQQSHIKTCTTIYSHFLPRGLKYW